MIRRKKPGKLIERRRRAGKGPKQTRDPKAKVHSAMASLGSPESEVRWMAVHNLGLFGDKEAVLPLTRALKDPSPKVQREACRALARLKDPQAVPSLIELFNSEESVETVMVAAEALGEIGDKRAFETLAKGAQKEKFPAGSACLEALAELKDERALKYYAPLLEGSNPFLSNLVIRCIEKTGSIKGVPLLLKASVKGGIQQGRAIRAIRSIIEEHGLKESDKARLALAEEFFKSLETSKKEILLATLASDSNMLRQLPTSLTDKKQRNGREFLKSLKEDAQTRQFDEMADILAKHLKRKYKL